MENIEKKYATRGNSRVKIKKPSMYNVVMLNDDFTPMDFVVDVLIKYFEKTEAEATNLMLTVHHGKKAIVGTYVYDVAMTKTLKVTQDAREKGYPFKVVVERQGQ